LLTTEKEIALLKQLGDFPQVIAEAAEKAAPQRVTHYVFDLASHLHSFYNAEKVLDEDHIELTNARIALVKAVRITIANALRLLGHTAPEKMYERSLSDIKLHNGPVTLKIRIKMVNDA